MTFFLLKERKAPKLQIRKPPKKGQAHLSDQRPMGVSIRRHQRRLVRVIRACQLRCNVGCRPGSGEGGGNASCF